MPPVSHRADVNFQPYSSLPLEFHHLPRIRFRSVNILACAVCACLAGSAVFRTYVEATAVIADIGRQTLIAKLGLCVIRALLRLAPGAVFRKRLPIRTETGFAFSAH